MTIALGEHQYELNGVVFGRDTPIMVESFQPGGYDIESNDASLPREDGRRFGVDFFTGRTMSFEIYIISDSDVFEDLRRLQRAWKANDTRLGYGTVVPLRYRKNGRTRRVYGRPRSFSYTPGRTFVNEITVTAEFVTVDELFYHDAPRELTLSSVPRFERQTNRVTNPSSENDVNLWTASAATAARSTSRAWSGDASLELTGDGTSNPHWVETEFLAVEPNTAYTASAYVSVGSGFTESRVRLTWYDSSQTEVGSETGAATTIDQTWTRVILPGAASPSGAAFAKLRVYLDPSSETQGVGYVDAAMLTLGESAREYFDGAGDQTRWTGTPHASTSELLAGIVFPVTFPITFAGGVPQEASATNDGDEYAWPEFTFYGPRSPAVTYHDGRRLEVAFNLGVTDKVVVDTRPWARSAVLNDGTDVSGALRGDPLSELAFGPGRTILDFQSGDTSGRSTMTASWHPAESAL